MRARAYSSLDFQAGVFREVFFRGRLRSGAVREAGEVVADGGAGEFVVGIGGELLRR